MKERTTRGEFILAVLWEYKLQEVFPRLLCLSFINDAFKEDEDFDYTDMLKEFKERLVS